MDTLTINIGVGSAIGIIATMAGSLILIAWKGGERFKGVETTVDGLKDQLARIWTFIEGNQRGLVQTQSPIQLTEDGRKALIASGLRDYVDQNFSSLMSTCSLNEQPTAYDVQTASMKCMSELKFPQQFDLRVKQFAFEQGVSSDTVRTLGGIYLRDKVLEKLGLNLGDVEKVGE